MRRSPTLRTVLLCVLVSGTLSLNFQVFVPKMAQKVFDGKEAKVVAFQIALGFGALLASFMAARRREPTGRLLAQFAAMFGGSLLAFAAAPTELVAKAAAFAVGYGFISFMLTANATLQLASDPTARGRVMALYGVMFAGTTPVGAPFVGWIADHFGIRTSVTVGGLASFVTAAIAIAAIRARRLPAGPPVLDATL